MGATIAGSQYLGQTLKWFNETELGNALQMLGFAYGAYRLTTPSGTKTIQGGNKQPNTAAVPKVQAPSGKTWSKTVNRGSLPTGGATIQAPVQIPKLSTLTDAEKRVIADKYKQKSPISIPDSARITAETKSAGYEQIQYTWSDGEYNYTARWHTSTPNAPQGTLPNWRIDRKKPGFPGGKDPVTGNKLQGYPSVEEVMIKPPGGSSYYISMDKWKAANNAYLKGVCTQEQTDILKWGHIINK